MITNTGKNILAKYLVGQTQSYASHIAIGCGAKVVSKDHTFSNEELLVVKNKQNLDFEMLRVPIISRGFVNENGLSKVVLTAELPTEERYEITEVGIFSAGSNPVAGSFDSRAVYSFAETDNWKYTASGSSAVPIPSRYEPLDDRVVKIINASSSGSTITYTTDISHGLSIGTRISIYGIAPTVFNLSDVAIVTVPSGTSFTVNLSSPVTGTFVSSGYLINDVETNMINQVYPVFQTNADNKVFTQTDRVERNERCRFLNNIIMMSGDTSTLTIDSLGVMQPSSTSNYIVLNNPSVDFTKNSPIDELRLSFSVVSKVANSLTVPDNVKILVEFSHTGSDASKQYAKYQVNIDDKDYAQGTANKKHDLELNRYVVSSNTFQEIKKSPLFNWADVSVVKIYASVTKNNVLSNNFYVCLDALRLENITETNSLYGLTGYSVIKNINSRPIIKSANTTNYIEFRFALDV